MTPGGSVSKESACNVEDSGSIPGSGRSPGEGVGYPLQYSGLENPMDCTVCGVAKSRTRLSDFHFTFTRGQSLTVIDALLLLIRMMISSINGFPGGSDRWRIRLQCGRPGFDPWVGKSPWRRAWQPTPVFLPGESPWTDGPGRLQSTGSPGIGHN